MKMLFRPLDEKEYFLLKSETHSKMEAQMKPLLESFSIETESSETEESSSSSKIHEESTLTPVEKPSKSSKEEAKKMVFDFKITVNHQSKQIVIDMCERSRLTLFPRTFMLTWGTKTIIGDAMLDVEDSHGKKNWCGFKDLTLKFGPETGKRFIVPDWWHTILAVKPSLIDTLFSPHVPNIPYQHTNNARHAKVLENLWPLSEETFAKIENLKLEMIG